VYDSRVLLTPSLLKKLRLSSVGGWKRIMPFLELNRCPALRSICTKKAYGSYFAEDVDNLIT
jgi:hypothetical protein